MSTNEAGGGDGAVAGAEVAGDATAAGETASLPVDPDRGPRRGFRDLVGAPGAPTHLVMTIGLVALGLWAASGSPFLLLIGQFTAVYAVAAVGQWLLLGRAGQIAITGAAFMAIGAFTTGLLVDTFLEPFPVPVIVAAVVGGVVGLIAGVPGIRYKGLYLLLASVALHFIVEGFARDYQLDNAPAGLPIPLLELGGLDLSIGRPLFITTVVVLVLVLIAVWAVERTGVGLAWSALKESEVAAAISGVDVDRWKLYAFALSGAITAIAGSMFSYVIGLAEYESYDIYLSISVITMVFIGGLQSRVGVLLGAVVISALPFILQNHLSDWLDSLGISAGWYTDNQSQVNAGLFSLAFLMVVLFSPRGLEGLFLKVESGIRRLWRFSRRRVGPGRAGGGEVAGGSPTGSVGER